jgi:aminopeptidase
MNVPTPARSAPHEERLDRLAEVAVKVGLGLAPGPGARLDGAPRGAAPSCGDHRTGLPGRRVPSSPPCSTTTSRTLLRYRHAPPESFDRTMPGSSTAWRRRSGTGRRAWRSAATTPASSRARTPDKVSRANRARSRAYRSALELITNTRSTGPSCPTRPGLGPHHVPGPPEAEAVARLWEAIFAASRVDAPDPVAAWAEHNRALEVRTRLMNGKAYASAALSGGRARTSPSASRTGTNGSAARPRRRTASPATPTSRPRRCSPRPTGTGSTGWCAPPSRCPTTAP